MDVKKLGLLPYRQTWQIQLSAVAALQKQEGGEALLLVEHPPVFTLGFHGNAGNMLLSETMLSQRGIELIRIERGGDITYHGPGQLVAYPILDLRAHGLGVKAYVHLLEESVIRLLAEYGIDALRDPDAPGVWLDAGTPRMRKYVLGRKSKPWRHLPWSGPECQHRPYTLLLHQPLRLHRPRRNLHGD